MEQHTPGEMPQEDEALYASVEGLTQLTDSVVGQAILGADFDDAFAASGSLVAGDALPPTVDVVVGAGGSFDDQTLGPSPTHIFPPT